VLAEIEEFDSDQRGCRGGHEHLPSMAGVCNPRCAVNVHAYVALLGDEGCACVHAKPDLNPPDESRGDRRCRLERTRSSRKGEEEGVALRIHFEPAVRRTRLADQAPMIGQSDRVPACP
jgi:hypothetical protein